MAPTQLSIVLERMLNELGIADLSTFEAVCHIWARRTLESAEEFDSSRFFLEALLATTTYETFLGLMMTEARRVKDKRDSKLDTIDEDEEKSGHK